MLTDRGYPSELSIRTSWAHTWRKRSEPKTRESTKVYILLYHILFVCINTVKLGIKLSWLPNIYEFWTQNYLALVDLIA